MTHSVTTGARASGFANNLVVAPVLSPGASWNGTAGSGGAAPAASATPLGTLVPDETVTGNFADVPNRWVHGTGDKISVVCLPPQDPATTAINYMKEVEFWLEGNSVTVTDWSVNDTPRLMPDGTFAPQGTIGFAVEIGAGTGAVTAGEAILYAYMRGEHGLERRVEIPLTINVDGALDPVTIDFTANLSGATSATMTTAWAGATGTRSLFFSNGASKAVTLTNGSTAVSWSGAVTANSRAYANRPRYFVDPVNGSDSNAGNKPGSGFAWKSLNKAHFGSVSGALVEMAAGTYVEDVNGGTPTVLSRALEFVPAAGLDASDITITRSNRLLNNGQWVIRAQKTVFKNVTVDLTQIQTVSGSLNPNMVAFLGCRMVDSNGANGPIDANGYDIGYTQLGGTLRDSVGTLFPASNGSRAYVAESECVNYHIVGAYLYRNVTAEVSADVFATGGGTNESDSYDNVVVDGYTPTMARSFQQRLSVETELEVASAVYSAGTGRTVITLTGSPTIASYAAGVAADRFVQAVTGSQAGTTLPNYAMDSTAKTVTVTGNLGGLASGDKIRAYLIWHADFCQQQGINTPTQRGIRNITLSRYRGLSPTAQLFLTQGLVSWMPSNVAVTITTSGTSFTLSSAQTFRAGDVIRLTTGAQAGQARMIAADGTSTTTGTLLEPFTANQAGETCIRGKTMEGFAMYTCILHKTGTGNELGQFQEGHRNFVIAHSTFLGRRVSSLDTISFRNSTAQAHGHRNHKQLFNIYGQVVSDSSFPTTADGLRLQFSQYLSGTDRGGDGLVDDPLLNPVTYLPEGPFLALDRKPLVPFDINGTPLRLVPVGAVVA